jgi:hypothetical protein
MKNLNIEGLIKMLESWQDRAIKQKKENNGLYQFFEGQLSVINNILEILTMFK